MLKGIMEESLHFHTDMAAPVIHISRATYGIPGDASRVVDVTLEVQSSPGTKLHIGTDVDLTKVQQRPLSWYEETAPHNLRDKGFIGAVVRERRIFSSQP